MVVVYLSLALAVLAIIYLIVSALRTFKAMQPTLKSVSGTTAKIQKQVQGVQHETEQLKKKANELQQEIQSKKQVVQNMITNLKWSGEEFKSLWKWARMMPNPKQVKTVHFSPESQRIVDRCVSLLAKWKALKN